MSRSILTALCMMGFLLAKETVPENVVPGQVVFKLSPQTTLLKGKTTATGVPMVDAVLSKYNLHWVEPMFPTARTGRRDLPDISRIYVATYESSASPFAIARELERLRTVLYAEPRFIYKVEETPNDSLYAQQWYLSKIAASQAWDLLSENRKTNGAPTVLVAVVDNGFDMNHPDLKSNYFTNPNEIPDNGVDDDNNRFVDDIHGWDFAGPNSEKGAQPDNDPSNGPKDDDGFWLHGTHLAGVANAVTDNKEGVAGVAWNVRTLPVKAGYEDTPQFIHFGYDGIKYAADLGAHVINCSWGGIGFSKVGADIVEYATRNGSLVIGAGGNEDSDEHYYPSAFEEVLGVAATGQKDSKSSFSNFGTSVDVSAPGEALLSTTPDGAYQSIHGTSVASPVAAGLAALVKSFFPSLTNKELALRIAGTTDNIDIQNPVYAGLLGSGRVNANKAMISLETQFVDIPPKIELVTANATDGIGGDGFFDRGEEMQISTTYRNYSLGAAREYTIGLSLPDSHLTIVKGLTSSKAFPADTTQSMSNELSFKISESARAHMAKVAVNLQVDGQLHVSDTLSVTIGKMPVLVVNDGGNDGGRGNSTSIVEGFYTGLLDEQDILYGVWDHHIQGSPSLELLNKFPTVIWFTEWHFPSLDDADRSALRKYLDNGGNLFLCGQDLGWDIADPDGTERSDESLSFFNDYLHATWGGDDAESNHAEGVFDDPISHGLSFDFFQPDIPEEHQYPDWFTPDDQAVLIFRYDNGDAMGLRYEGKYRLVYTGIGLEAIGSNMDSKPPKGISDTQRTVLSRILRYLNFIHHEPLTDTERTDELFEVDVDVTGDISDLSGVKLYHKTSSTNQYASLDMTPTGQGNFEGSIPAPGDTALINYYIETENSYYRWTNPAGAPKNVFSFYAGPDTIPPVINFVSEIGDRVDRSGSEEIFANATDNIGIDSVILNWSTSMDPSTVRRTAMALHDEGWKGDLSWENVPYHSTFSYWITAVDSSSNRNDAASDPLSFSIVKMARLTAWEEQDLSGWNTGDGWGSVFINTTQGYGVEDSPGIAYENNANNILSKREPVHISTHQSAYLKFWNRAFLHKGEDFGYVELSSDGTVWDTVSTITGRNVKRTEMIDLRDYMNKDVHIRFRMTSDQENTSVGWFVDDLYILVDTTLGIADAEYQETLPAEFLLEQNYPNPFNSTTTIGYSLPRRAEITLVIYDVLGREVVRLIDGPQDAGRHELIWNGALAASGVYIYRLQTDGVVKSRKLLLLK